MSGDKISEEDGGVHEEEAHDEEVVDEAEDAEDHFRNDVERAEDVEEGKPCQQEDPDPEDDVDPFAGPGTNVIKLFFSVIFKFS